MDATIYETLINAHLLKNRYTGASVEERSAALRMAELDICCELGVKTLPDGELCRNAVVEQMFYLLVNRSRIGADLSVEAESVDGLGSVSYRGNGEALIAPRARRLLEQMREPLRLQRG